jgi:nucleoside-diphosphate-sugar epimerase
VPRRLEGKDVELARGDVRDAAAVARALEGVEEVHHLAAVLRTRTRRQMFDVNVGGTMAMLDAASRVGLAGRFVLCSSQAATGPSEPCTALDESAPHRPVTWYGESKAAAEEATLAAAGRLAVTVLRPPGVYGPEDRDFLAAFRAASWGVVPTLGAPSRQFSLVYVEDLARAFVEAARSPRTRGRVYFASHPDVVSQEDLAEHLSRAVGRRVLRLRLPESFVRVLAGLSDLLAQLGGSPPLLSRQKVREVAECSWLCSPAALERDAGWRASVPLPEGIARTVAWYRDRGWL